MVEGKNIVISNDISLSELAEKIQVAPTELIKSLMNMGVMVTANRTFKPKSAVSVLEKMGIEATYLESKSLSESGRDSKNKIQKLGKDSRSPIVTIMGHVDHGKTSLLDYIRKTNVVKKESGGITQSIGAYSVDVSGKSVTFLDTPGHEAFTEMRSRGAYCTDIVILVVAVDDGVMPQTIEAIRHAQSAGVSIMVAITKIDKKSKNIENIKKQLANYGVVTEDWGGEVLVQGVSCISGEGIDELLENILLQAEMLQLKTKISGSARGIVIESRLDRNCGPLASVIITQGMLSTGDYFVVGNNYGKVKSMRNDKGVIISQANPSDPVEILGCIQTPLAGEEIFVVKDEKTAKKIAFEGLKDEEGNNTHGSSAITDLETESSQEKINFILKADTRGSVEAVSYLLQRLSTDDKKINIIYSSVGEFNESDVRLAMTAQAILLGFNIQASKKAKALIKKENVTFYSYDLIYAVSDLVSSLLKKSREEFEYTKTGTAEVRNIFTLKNTTIAGCMIMDGIFKRNSFAHIIRQKSVVHKGNIDSIKRFKENAKEVQGGMECGIVVQGFNKIEVGDIIECYEKAETKKYIR